ncbi:MAG TPA: PHP domain-containing protein [Acidimicrobiia bacterium]|nr:PHP domain-containing protein [Acidimicrobiia bacterium]
MAVQLWRLADLEQANTRGRSFRARAYRRGVWSLDHLSPELRESPEEMLAIPGIGAAIAGLIGEFRANGDLGAVTAREQRLPHQAWELSRLPRMTPKRLHALKADLEVESIADLRRAIDEGAAQALPGVGPQTAAYWLRTIDEQREGVPIYLAVGFAHQLVSHIEEHVPGSRVSVTGAIARLDEWIEEIELAVSGANGVSEFLTSSAAVAGLPIPVRITNESPQVPAGLVQSKELRGDLHVHSDWSPDGRQSLRQVVAVAASRGYEYIGITDHAVGLRFGGLDIERLHAQRAEIDRVREEHPEISVLHGAELNIARDGSVDFDHERLSWLDYTVAGIHSFLGLERDEQTARVLAAIANPEIDIIAHLTGRRIGIRPPINVDLAAVFTAAADQGTILEVNGHLDRLDLSAELIESAIGHGIEFVADSDSHRPGEFANVENACVLLQRAGVRPESVVNTWSLEALRTRL